MLGGLKNPSNKIIPTMYTMSSRKKTSNVVAIVKTVRRFSEAEFGHFACLSACITCSFALKIVDYKKRINI
jgi:hypothetical protein